MKSRHFQRKKSYSKTKFIQIEHVDYTKVVCDLKKMRIKNDKFKNND